MPTREHMESMCDNYLAAVESRDPDQVMKVFSDNPTVEDPIGSKPRVGAAAVRGFYSNITGSVRLRRIGPACVVGNHAAFLFRLDIERDGKRESFSSIDVMTFDDGGHIMNMVAYPDHGADPGALGGWRLFSSPDVGGGRSRFLSPLRGGGVRRGGGK